MSKPKRPRAPKSPAIRVPCSAGSRAVGKLSSRDWQPALGNVEVKGRGDVIRALLEDAACRRRERRRASAARSSSRRSPSAVDGAARTTSRSRPRTTSGASRGLGEESPRVPPSPSKVTALPSSARTT